MTQNQRLKRAMYRLQDGKCFDCGWRLPVNDLNLHWDGDWFLLCPPCKIEAQVQEMWARA